MKNVNKAEIKCISSINTMRDAPKRNADLCSFRCQSIFINALDAMVSCFIIVVEISKCMLLSMRTYRFDWSQLHWQGREFKLSKLTTLLFCRKRTLCRLLLLCCQVSCVYWSRRCSCIIAMCIRCLQLVSIEIKTQAHRMKITWSGCMTKTIPTSNSTFYVFIFHCLRN